jgi:hypothetical protein
MQNEERESHHTARVRFGNEDEEIIPLSKPQQMHL